MNNWRHIALLPLLALAGCPAQTAPPPATAPVSELPAPLLAMQHTQAPSSSAAQPGAVMVAMDVYQITVPQGAISRSDEFWKRVDENIDVGIYDLLLKNGVRVGIGDDKDWPFFKALIDNYHVKALTGSSNLSQEGSLELPLKTKIDYEDLFWFDTRDILWGRTFEHCDNLLSITFEPHPHKTDSVIINVCPLIRGLRRQLQFTVRNGEYEIENQVPEQLLDLHVEADIPPAHFLVLAPTEDAKWPTSLGQAFLIKDGPAQRLETVMILAPRTQHLAELP